MNFDGMQIKQDRLHLTQSEIEGEVKHALHKVRVKPKATPLRSKDRKIIRNHGEHG
jgi:hypothetical protein